MLQAVEDGSVQWMQSKLMFIGEGRAGKTCTLRSLLGKPFVDTASTLGCDLSTCKIDRTNVQNWTEAQDLGKQSELAAAQACATSMKERAAIGNQSPDQKRTIATGDLDQPLQQETSVRRDYKSISEFTIKNQSDIDIVAYAFGFANDVEQHNFSLSAEKARIDAPDISYVSAWTKAGRMPQRLPIRSRGSSCVTDQSKLLKIVIFVDTGDIHTPVVDRIFYRHLSKEFCFMERHREPPAVILPREHFSTIVYKQILR